MCVVVMNKFFLKNKKVRLIIFVFCLALFLYSVSILQLLNKIKILRKNEFAILTMIDVGQGDAFNVLLPNGISIYIDVGEFYKNINKNLLIENKCYESANNYLSSMAFKIRNFFTGIYLSRKADMVILSHDDEDHAGAIKDFSKEYRIGSILISDFEYNNLSQIPNLSNTQIVKVRSGDDIMFGNTEDHLSKIIYTSDQIDINTKYINQVNGKNNIGIKRSGNSESIVMSVKIFDTKVLFTGDMGKTEEKILSEKIQDRDLESNVLKADILKVAHHGSKTSTGKGFLDKVNPSFALISMGSKNKYGHPHKSVIDNLGNVVSGSNIIRTDICGTYSLYIYKDGAIGRRLCKGE